MIPIKKNKIDFDKYYHVGDSILKINSIDKIRFSCVFFGDDELHFYTINNLQHVKYDFKFGR